MAGEKCLEFQPKGMAPVCRHYLNVFSVYKSTQENLKLSNFNDIMAYSKIWQILNNKLTFSPATGLFEFEK